MFVVFKGRRYYKECLPINKRNIVVGLDVGSSFTKAALGEVRYNDIHILGLAQVPSRGVRKGNIIDIEGTAATIDQCLNELERLTGLEIDSTLLGFSGASISIMANHAVVAVGTPDNEISREDKERVLYAAQNIVLPPDRCIVQMIERQYIVDGYEGVKDPVGMVGSRLEVEVVLIIAAIAAVQNLQRSAQRSSLAIEKLIYNQLFVAEAVLSSTEKEMGVALVDMGGGTIEITVFAQGSILFSSVLPIGSEYITRDLAIVLRTSLEEANRIKEDLGVAATVMAKEDQWIQVQDAQGKEARQISQYVIADIISARVLEMADMIRAELELGSGMNRLPGGLVLTGGGARLNGLVEVMEDYLNIPVRLGVPECLKDLSVEGSGPQNAAAVGTLLYAVRHMGRSIEPAPGVTSVFEKINLWLRDLFS